MPKHSNKEKSHLCLSTQIKRSRTCAYGTISIKQNMLINKPTYLCPRCRHSEQQELVVVEDLE